MSCRLLIWAAIASLSLAPPAFSADPPLTQPEAAKALHKAVNFFRQQVSIKGGYLWRYSHDLSLREGEGRASATTAWVQPPGTPSVGNALLQAFQNTGDDYYLEAATETAHALVAGQLKSGGWDYRITFDASDRLKYAYRVLGEEAGSRNTSTLDDNTSQSALRFLIRIDQQLGFRDKRIHDAARYALQALLRAQYPNGAWPQRFSEYPDPDKFPVRKAAYPQSWPRTHPAVDYRSFYTFNDNTIADTISVMLDSAVVYAEPAYREAAIRAGDFIILAQMPEPQPAWAQQYNSDGHPAWARKFEPPAVTGGESQGVMSTLMMLYRRTGEKKFLQPIPPALAYLKSSRLPDGRLARFYELKTNRPLYFTREYELVYHDRDLPTHYGFKVSSKLDRIGMQYKQLVARGPDKPAEGRPAAQRAPLTASLQAQAATIVAALDSRGAWVEDGTLRYQESGETTSRIISCPTFIHNVEVLSRFVGARR